MPSGSGYLLEISYDDGGTWQTIGANQPLGLNSLNPTTQFPDVEASAHVVFRATNNDTAASGTSSEVTLIADQVEATFGRMLDSVTVEVWYVYASDATPASLSTGSISSWAGECDTDDGPEPSNNASQTGDSTVSYSFNSPITSGGSFTQTDGPDATWNRPAATLSLPQTFGIP